MGCYPTEGHYELNPGAAATRLRRGLLSDHRFPLSSLPGLRSQTETKGFPSGGKEHPSRSQTVRGVTVIINIIHERKVDQPGALEPNTGIAFARIHRQFRKQHDPGELQLHRAGDAVRWPFKITGLTKFLGSLLILAALSPTVQAGQSVTLAWNRSSDTNVVGYNVYYGGASSAYTNEISVGNATNATITGLVQGTTYYFAATTYVSSGMESPFSSELSYTVPILAGVQFRVTPTRQFVLTVTGPTGYTYNIQATQDFITSTVIGTVTVGASGSLNFTDTNAASFSRRFYRTQG